MSSKKFFKLNYDVSTGFLYIDTNCFKIDRDSNSGEFFEENNKSIYYVLDFDWANPKPYRFVEGNDVHLGFIKLETTKNITAVANVENKYYYSTIAIPERLYPPIFTGQIFYLQDLDRIRENLTFNCTLMNNLDFESDSSYNQKDPDWETKRTLWTTTGWTKIAGFNKVFNGNYFKIENILGDSLFSNNAGTIQGLKLTGDITCNTSNSNVSLLCSINTGLITQCSIHGTIVLDNTEDISCGGIIGLNQGTIHNCYSDVDISVIGTVTGYVGGIVGLMYNDQTSLIKHCYAIGSIPVMSSAGGIIGGFPNPETNGDRMFICDWLTPTNPETNGDRMFVCDWLIVTSPIISHNEISGKIEMSQVDGKQIFYTYSELAPPTDPNSSSTPYTIPLDYAIGYYKAIAKDGDDYSTVVSKSFGVGPEDYIHYYPLTTDFSDQVGSNNLTSSASITPNGADVSGSGQMMILTSPINSLLLSVSFYLIVPSDETYGAIICTNDNNFGFVQLINSKLYSWLDGHDGSAPAVDVTINELVHLVFIKNNTTFTLYVNGVSSGDYVGYDKYLGGFAGIIGFAGYECRGIYSDIKIFDRILTQEEINSL